MDEKNIISYKPDLNIHGKTTTTIKGNGGIHSIQSNDIKYNEELNTNKSSTLVNFIYYSPLSVINSIENVLNNIQNSLMNIENNISDNNYENSYFSSQGDKEKEDEVLKKNSNDIEFGSNVLEAYSYMKTMYEDLNEILNLYMECLFGNDIDTSEVENIINTYIEQIEGYEAKEEYQKVNYMSLYYDTKVSYILSDFVSKLDDICYELSCIQNATGDVRLDSKAYNLIKKYFNKENNTLDSYIYACSNCKDEISTAIKNLYLQKQELLNDLEAFDDIYDISKDLYNDINNGSYSSLNECTSNIIKSCMNYNLNYGDISDSVNKKSKYRNFL